MQKLKTKEFWVSLVMCLIGVLGIILMVKHIFDWAGFGPIVEDDPGSIYQSGEVTRWSNLLYFTNITLFIFCIYTILNFVGVLFDIKKLKNFLNNPYVLLFIGINQFLVLFVFTLMAAVFGLNIDGEWLKFPINRHNFAASIFKHYVLTITAVVYVFTKKPRKKVSFKKCLWFLLYPVVYAVIVKVCGLVCFDFEWYPYPFFGTKPLWYNIFHTLDKFNFTYALLMVMACILVIAGVYILFTYLACFVYNRLAEKEKVAFDSTGESYVKD